MNHLKAFILFAITTSTVIAADIPLNEMPGCNTTHVYGGCNYQLTVGPCAQGPCWITYLANSYGNPGCKVSNATNPAIMARFCSNSCPAGTTADFTNQICDDPTDPPAGGGNNGDPLNLVKVACLDELTSEEAATQAQGPNTPDSAFTYTPVTSDVSMGVTDISGEEIPGTDLGDGCWGWSAQDFPAATPWTINIHRDKNTWSIVSTHVTIENGDGTPESLTDVTMELSYFDIIHRTKTADYMENNQYLFNWTQPSYTIRATKLQ